MADGEEKDLIERAIMGESSAFGSLYDKYQPNIYRFVLIKVGRREDAEDITHQAFLHAWQHIRTYTHRGFPFSSWLYRIARNKVIDHYRTRGREPYLEELDAESFVEETSLHVTLDVRMTLARVHRALKHLKGDQQDVIVMRFVEDLSVKETAAALGKSEGAIKLIQHRAIKELKNVLKSQQ
jgi:RNA polymerase sigma-70 factor (ECF subfamily)